MVCIGWSTLWTGFSEQSSVMAFVRAAIDWLSKRYSLNGDPPKIGIPTHLISNVLRADNPWQG